MAVEEAVLPKKPVVLCVDDDPGVLGALQRLFRNEPFDVRTAASPEDALKVFDESPVDLVLLDQRMPGMSGSDLAARVRHLSPRTLRMMLTAYPGNALVKHGLSESIQWLISKPWNDDALRLAVREVLLSRDTSPKPDEEERPNDTLACLQTAQHSIAAILAEPITLSQTCVRVLKTVAQSLGWSVGLLWMPDSAGSGLHVAERWLSPTYRGPDPRKTWEDALLGPGDLLAGRVWTQGHASWIEDPHPGLRASCAAPMLLGTETVGVMEFLGPQAQAPSSELLDTIEEIGRHLALLVQRHRLEEERDSLFSMSIDMLALVGRDGYFKRLNGAWTRTLGWSSAELLSRPYLDFVHPDDRTRTLSAAAKVLRGQDAVCFENRCRAKDGSYRWLAWTCPSPRTSESPLHVVVRDVTEQRHAIENLRQSEERYRTLVDSAHDIVMTVSVDGRITSLNPAFESLTGRLRSDWVGRHFIELVEPEDLRSIISVLSGVLKGEPAPVIECRISTRGGGSLIVESSLKAQIGPSGISGALIIARDVTRRRQAEQERDRLSAQLLQGQKLQAIGQLSAGIAHEINNPVGYILSNLFTMRQYVDDLTRLLSAVRAPGTDDGALRATVDRLWDDIDGDFILADFRKAVDESRRGGERIRDIVRSLRDFSHVDQNALEDTDLNSVLEDTLRLCANELKYKAELQLDFGAMPRFKAHPQRLSQVFLNLLVNASQAIPDKGRITVQTRADERWATVLIRDSGCGIPGKDLHKIFDPFFTTKPVGQGTGLGLHVAYQIIHAHGGRIDVSSKPGDGSEFKVLLPLHPKGEPV